MNTASKKLSSFIVVVFLLLEIPALKLVKRDGENEDPMLELRNSLTVTVNVLVSYIPFECMCN